MTTLRAPSRFDVVGSFLRPKKLAEARADLEAGKITADQLKAVEDECIVDLIQKQKKAGLTFITDGEFRRATWHLDFMWGFNGVAHKKTTTGLPFHDEAAMIDDTYLVGKVSVDKHPFVEHFKFVKQFEDEKSVARQTMPAPAQFLFQMLVPDNVPSTTKIYPNIADLANDIAQGYIKVLKDLYDAGCRNVQFDDCTWGMLVDSRFTPMFAKDEEGIKRLAQQLLDINNAAIAGKPEGLTINTHVCRGNFHSTYACSGPYDAIAPFLFAQEKVDGFYLEFDDERSGGFDCLKLVPAPKKVVLGLITTKNPKLEDKDAVIARIQAASQFVPLDRLCLSPQCGFASCEIGNKLTEEEQWAKLALVREIVEKVWN